MTNYFTDEGLEGAIKRAETQRRIDDLTRECLFAILSKSGGEIRLTPKDQQAMFSPLWKMIIDHDPINGDLIIRAETTTQ
jgi:hypothetical protein